MHCPACNKAFNNEDRYCPQCGSYLSARPGPAHGDLMQLSNDDFVGAASEGLALIWENASRLWTEAREFSALGSKRGVGILKSFAEEEAAKALLLLDALRCPRNQLDKRRSLLRQIDSHVGKGIYIRYYDTRPADLTEVKRIVDDERLEFFRDGEYGEYLLPNAIKSRREERLYVTYIKNDDGTHGWLAPREPFHFEQHFYCGVIRVVEALHGARIFQPASLRAASAYWQTIPFFDIGSDPLSDKLETSIRWPALRMRNHQMLCMLSERNLLAPTMTVEFQQALTDDLLFPLYPFDLSLNKNFEQIGEPDWPEMY
jgi:hypothetical protein